MFRRKDKVVIIFIVLTLVIISCGVRVTWNSYPPQNFKKLDLIGTWEARYGPGERRIDRIILRANETYQQIYRESDEYTYESEWNKWSIETLPDGAVYLHLEGMRFYPDGRTIAELNGRSLRGTGKPHYFYDRYRDDAIQMLDKGILRIGTDNASGNAVLIQMEYDHEVVPYAFQLVE